MTEADKCLRLLSNRGGLSSENDKNCRKMERYFFAPYSENLAYDKHIFIHSQFINKSDKKFQS